LPNATLVSIAFVEVDPQRTTPSEYMKTVSGLEKPFDFIYLTPSADLTDHCAEIEKHLKTEKAEKTGER
jgi:cytochrome oxidase Cu insertion factor (SCO1/SenC/PrrC family)